MKSYQLPRRSFEDIYCRQQDKPEDCADKVRFGIGNKVNVSSVYSPVFERHFAEVAEAMYNVDVVKKKQLA
jgi:hypothetical protein